MDTTGEISQWHLVDEGWGRNVADEATLHEPQNVREYVALLARLGVGPGTRVLDVACGAGLALEVASAMGASVAGIDASPRLVSVARDRMPEADVHAGDMRELPWVPDSFDVVTSFRGIWGTTPEVLPEVLRVLRPGGRLGLTVWGHIKASPGAWALRPFAWASESDVSHQAAMNSLGRPGVGEAFLAQAGFVHVQRVDVPFAWEFADPAAYARTLASTGPAHQAIQQLGEERFLADAAALAEPHVRVGLPLRAEIKVAGFLGTKPQPVATGVSFLAEAALTDAVQALYDEDVEQTGFVMNVSRLWGLDPGALEGLFGVLDHLSRSGELSFVDRGILVTTAAATLGDAYCALAWGGKLAAKASPELSAAVLVGDDTVLDGRGRALAAWARRVATDPNATTPEDVDRLREAGFTDAQVLALTAYVALRIAFSTVNDALGSLPDAQFLETIPAPVRDAVTWGRPIVSP